MAADKISFKLPPALHDAVQVRWPRLKYQSLSAYIIGLIRYDLMVQGHHPTTLPIAQSRAEERDAVDAELRALTEKGVGVRGEFLVGFLKQIAGGQFSTAEEVAAELARILTQAKKG